VKGGRAIVFRNNTVAGDMPGNAFAVRFLREVDNPQNRSIRLINNIWSDPFGTMEDLSDGEPKDTTGLLLNNNLYWNNGRPIPVDTDVMNSFMDARGITANPLLASQTGLVLPNWRGTQFASGKKTIREEFERLVNTYGKPAAGSPVIGAANAERSPENDILDAPRGAAPDIGAFQVRAASSPLRLALFKQVVLGGEKIGLNRVFIAGTAGGTVFLTSSTPGVIVPARVTIPANEDSAPFTISTTAVRTPVKVTITATYGATMRTATLTVVPQGLVSVNASKHKLTPGYSDHLVMVAGPAAAPFSITLSSSRPNLLSFSGPATVAAGASYGKVRVHTKPVAVPTEVTITASYGGREASTIVYLQP
jgi:hypothetical protein